jgi:hypothetical protein
MSVKWQRGTDAISRALSLMLFPQKPQDLLKHRLLAFSFWNLKHFTKAGHYLTRLWTPGFPGPLDISLSRSLFLFNVAALATAVLQKLYELTAFATLYQQYSRRLFLVARRITKNHADAEDALQDALMRAFVNIFSITAKRYKLSR